MFNDVKVAFLSLKEAEKVNETVLNNVFKYIKLNLKILLTKVKYFGAFYKQDAYQALLS